MKKFTVDTLEISEDEGEVMIGIDWMDNGYATLNNDEVIELIDSTKSSRPQPL